MILSDKTYKILKTLGTIILPAIAAFYGTLAGIWGLPFQDKIPETIMAVVVMLNAWLKVKSSDYYEEKAKGADTVSYDDGMNPEG